MIIKLRNRLIATMMVFVSIILLMAFIAIYAISYIRIYNENTEKVNSEETVKITSDGKTIMNGQTIENAVVISRISPALGVHFNLVADGQGKILFIDSALALSQEDYTLAASMALNKPKGGIAELGDRKWQYTTGMGMYQVEESDGADTAPLSNGITTIRFLDVTDSYQTLQTLIFTLLGLYIVLMIVFFVLARYFAGRSIHPMAEAWENQRQFIADASHELKTPISTLNANIDVLYAGQEDTIRDQIKWLDNSKKVLSRMTTLLRDMLELAKVDEFGEKPSVDAVNMNELLENVLDYFIPAADKKQIHIVEDITPELRINSNYAMIQQVIEILLDNAIKYTNVNGQIGITSYRDKSELILRVANTGVGIASQDIGRIFDRFYRGDKSRVYQEGNYGLGLSIARAAVQKLGGNIDVQSNFERTIFTVKVPNKKLNHNKSKSEVPSI
jgi:two-component system sensor histidine kinase CiaH